ncbi:3-hydroxyacyl-[acyl-carrier-protein] dehydratase FabZ [Amylibacter ulvae]|uniref:3-hydroxyacyl-[acyl-carrier-protein] dehydratase FabZ n=1 Tax=Paramylibacter ulvae TaxID=1651968 RepID=A0ABQ3CUP2_9RHOB|nr:3-hydroxyacyl-ACP dehydratase FabZ [Amylibacter ulvae]GHA42315.1 3-hydroxyacyl-[acyl-carrier-protein] dehydratase FabZ [Amylibacter ulvae]
MAENQTDGELYHADIQDIKRMIPHRYPFLLIDAVRDMKLGESAVGIKNVTMNEPHFQGHFPERPVMPGVTIVEAMAQTAAVLVVKTLDMIDNDMLVYFLTIDKCKFRHVVSPPDQLELHVKVVRGRGKLWKFYGEGKVDGKVVAEAEFQAMMVPPEEA